MKMTKYNAIWHKVSAYIKKEFGSEPANKEYLKTKRKSMKLRIFMTKNS